MNLPRPDPSPTRIALLSCLYWQKQECGGLEASLRESPTFLDQPYLLVGACDLKKSHLTKARNNHDAPINLTPRRLSLSQYPTVSLQTFFILPPTSMGTRPVPQIIHLGSTAIANNPLPCWSDFGRPHQHPRRHGLFLGRRRR